MKIKRVLLTGDDGYRSLGTRLLINALADQYDLTVVGTKTQQSAVGGRMSLKEGFEWGEDEVDGVPAYWVSGTPADGMEFAAHYFSEPFDLILSGINWGANLGTTIFNSGTLGACFRGLSAQVAPKSIAISWDLPPEFYLIDHHQEELLVEYIEYPGKILKGLINLIIENDFWGDDLINVNLPQKVSNKVKMTSLILDATHIYDYTPNPFYEKDNGVKAFRYCGDRVKKLNLEKIWDAQALDNGFISVTPCRYSVDNPQTLEKNKFQEFKID